MNTALIIMTIILSVIGLGIVIWSVNRTMNKETKITRNI